MSSNDASERVAIGLERLGEGDAREALRIGDEVIGQHVGCAPAHELRALALTQLDRIEEANAAFARAAELDPEAYFRPFRLEREAFDDVVEQTLSRLPPRFRDYLENVEISVEDVPSPELIEEGLELDLLGVYIGGSADSDGWDFPDRVILFQRNIENISPDRDTLIKELRDTLLHEVGHHFGMDEETLREIEGES